MSKQTWKIKHLKKVWMMINLRLSKKMLMKIKRMSQSESKELLMRWKMQNKQWVACSSLS